MTRHFTNCPLPRRGHRAHTPGFSLVELLLVIAISMTLMALSVFALRGSWGGRDVARAAFDLAGMLEQARSYAMANNTYVWVGFYEEDGRMPSQEPAVVENGGRVIVSAVASRDGRRYNDAVVNGAMPAPFGSKDTSNPVELTQLSRLLRLENVRMVAANTQAGNVPPRPRVTADYQLGEPTHLKPDNGHGRFARRLGAEDANPTTFTYPLGTPAPQYTFSKIIEFSPSGEASKIVENVFTGPGPQAAMEIALLPAYGGTIDPAYAGGNEAAAAIQVEGLTGRIRVFRP